MMSDVVSHAQRALGTISAGASAESSTPMGTVPTGGSLQVHALSVHASDTAALTVEVLVGGVSVISERFGSAIAAQQRATIAAGTHVRIVGESGDVHVRVTNNGAAVANNVVVAMSFKILT